VVSPSDRSLISALARHDRLLEVGIGDRPAVAQALAERGCAVVGVDIDISDHTREAERDVRAGEDPNGGSFRLIEADIASLADPEQSGGWLREAPEIGFDAVYACRLPAELQRPTLALANRLNAACLFTTIGFEEPIVPVSRRSLSGATLYVAREHGEQHPSDRR